MKTKSERMEKADHDFRRIPSWLKREKMSLRFTAKSKKRGNEDLPIVIRIQNSRNDGC
jgi:ribosomal protein L39E